MSGYRGILLVNTLLALRLFIPSFSPFLVRSAYVITLYRVSGARGQVIRWLVTAYAFEVRWYFHAVSSASYGVSLPRHYWPGMGRSSFHPMHTGTLRCQGTIC